jgi:Protein of unknown function (DUF3102)
MIGEITVEKDVIAEINQLHLDQCATAKQAIETAIRIGGLLTDQRAKCKRGEWLTWLKDNIQFSERTAQNYLRIYRDRQKYETVADLYAAYRIALPRSQKKVKKPTTKINIGLFGGIPVKLELSDKEFKLLNRALNPQSAPNEIEKALITFGLSLRMRRSSIQRFLGTDKAA